MDPPTCPPILKIYEETSTELSHVYHVGSQGYVPEAAPGSGKDQQNPHRTDRSESEEPLSAWVQLTGQLVVTSP